MIEQNFHNMLGIGFCILFIELFKKSTKLICQVILNFIKNIRAHVVQEQLNLLLEAFKKQTYLMKKVMP